MLLAFQIGDGFSAVVVFQLLDLQNLADGLRDRQVARRQQHHETVVGLLVDDHLRKVLMWSRPALVRESDKNTSPALSLAADAVSHEVVWKWGGRWGSWVALVHGAVMEILFSGG